LNCSIKKNNNNLRLSLNGKNNFKSIEAKKIVLGIGIVSPNQSNFRNINNKNYIGDFYAEGGTDLLIRKLKKIKKKKISVIFIGNKAGLLECMQKLQAIIKTSKKKIKLISISSNLISLEKAVLSNNFSNLKLKYFNIKYLKKIKKSEDIYKILINEFKIGTDKGFKKYDVWTKILRLNTDKSKKVLNFSSKLTLSKSIDLTINWYKNYLNKQNMTAITEKQIKDYFKK